MFLSGDCWSNERELDAYKVACYGLRRPCKVEQTIILKEVSLCVIGASDLEYTTFELDDDEVIEPVSAVDRVQ